MGVDGIYRKTEKGRTEIATRANKLGLRERTLLIMVDDKTTRDALLAQGFIEIDSGTVPAASTAAGTVPAAPPAGQAPVEVSLASATHFACRALVTYLGPSADDLTALVEQSTGVTELATVLEKCRQIIQSLAGKKKGDDFWADVSARLPKA